MKTITLDIAANAQRHRSAHFYGVHHSIHLTELHDALHTMHVRFNAMPARSAITHEFIQQVRIER